MEEPFQTVASDVDMELNACAARQFLARNSARNSAQFGAILSRPLRRLRRYREKMEAINEGSKAEASMADTTKALASTISALPELQRKKGEIDAHMNIATCLLEQIKSRSLDSFYSIEECVMERRSLPKDDRATLTQPMADGEGGGSVDDRSASSCSRCTRSRA